MTHSVMAGVLIGRDRAEVEARVQAQIEMFGDSEAAAEAWLEPRRSRWVIGTLDKARARIAEFEAAGVQRLLLQDFLPRDLEHVALMGELIRQR
jgi:alkanesulfonate monooxygenase SsuD/methylene tetrahydromethanopterin reductase-like flavin-dependent oxidoreductase (luciferase family)